MLSRTSGGMHPIPDTAAESPARTDNDLAHRSDGPQLRPKPHNVKRIIDLNTWNRREHFRFFSAFDDPFFGVTAQVDVTALCQRAQAAGGSFFLHSVHHLLGCIHRTEAFRLRIEQGQVVRHDTIHLSPTIGRTDGTFGFGFFAYDADFDRFRTAALCEIERVKNSSGLCRNADAGRTDLIRYSALPWFAFTEMKHAVSFGNGDSVPRVSTGRLTCEQGRCRMPVSVCVHHGLADGRDVAELFDLLAQG